MASLNDIIANEINSSIEKAARRIYHKNFKLSSKEVAGLMDAYLQKLVNEKTMTDDISNKNETLAHQLVYNAVSDIDNVKISYKDIHIKK